MIVLERRKYFIRIKNLFKKDNITFVKKKLTLFAL